MGGGFGKAYKRASKRRGSGGSGGNGGGDEITDRLIGADEAFVTAPAILDGEPLIKFYRDDDTVLETKAKVTVKTDKARMGKLILMQN